MSKNDINNDIVQFNSSEYRFDSVVKLEGCDLAVVKKNGRYEILDIVEKKSILDNLMNVDIDKFSEGMLPIAESCVYCKTPILWGYLNVFERTIIRPRFRTAGVFTEGFAFVSSYLEKYNEGIINKKGYEVIPLQFSILGDITNDFFITYNDNEYWLFDKSWHKMPLWWCRPISSPLGKNKFSYKNSEHNMFHPGYVEYTFYPLDIENFILVKECYDSGTVSYDIRDIHSGNIFRIDDLYNEDCEKIKKIMI